MLKKKTNKQMDKKSQIQSGNNGLSHRRKVSLIGNKNPNGFHVNGLVRDKETKTRDWGQVRATCKPALESSDHQKVAEHFQLHEKEIRKYFRIAFSHVCCVIGLKKCASPFLPIIYKTRNNHEFVCFPRCTALDASFVYLLRVWHGSWW